MDFSEIAKDYDGKIKGSSLPEPAVLLKTLE